ncbi:hypothetical protein [Alicyclobacillus contaminans]|uniref:hypothetical protein n=1 Tax=Alicyclobacillus contaminans TaxID=392016 RepID=UPI0012EBF53D|nr:hypothetical protein [Alicyclobacillus contaminans]
MDAIRWLEQYIDNAIDKRLRDLGIPRLLIPGVVQSVTTSNGNTFANVFLNGSTTAATNIPVNPDIAANVTANTPVWVMCVNFNNLDMFVLARKLA